jgi:hypothetical protein
MVEISFNTKNLDEDVKQRLEPLFARIAADLSNYIGDEVPVGATANLRNSVQILGFNSDTGSQVVAVRADYANAVRLGREPGSFPPLQPLRKWVSRVIGEQEYLSWQGDGWQVNSLDEATYLVGKSIEESGTDPNPYLERALDRLKTKYS